MVTNITVDDRHYNILCLKSSYFLKCKHDTCLYGMDILVIRQSILVNLVQCIVEHYLGVIIERIVGSYGERIDVSTTYAA